MNANDPVGDFVSANPWATVAVGAGVAIAAGVTAWLFARSSTPAATTTTTTTTSTSDGSTKDGSTRKPTTTTTSTPTSTTTSTSSSSSSSAPSYDAGKAVSLYIQNAGKQVPIGTSLLLLDASTGQPVNGAVEGSTSVLAAGPTTGTFVAIGAGTVKLYAPDGQSTTVVVSATTAGVPRVAGLLLPRALRAA